MSFQQPSNTTAPGAGFTFGAANTTAGMQPAAAKPGFTFGATGGGDAGGTKPLSFGGFGGTAAAPATAAAAPAPTSTPSLGLGATGTPSFGFGAAAATTGAAPAAGTGAVPAPGSTSGFSFGTAATPVASAAAMPAVSQSLVATPATGFNFGASSAAANSAASTGSANATTTTAAPATIAPPQAAATAALPAPAKSAAPPGIGGGFASLNTATKTTESSAVSNTSQLTYNQLEEHINKWTLELEEQEKVFTDQATQINAWDKILISNNHKILDLNDAVHKLKSDQQTLEQELEFIATQHKELEESIMPLQKEFLNIPQVDVERSQTYLMVENLDTQLKQMSEDLKEIIDNLNESNRCQDNTDPIIQIGKILNAHMSSLQWIEQSTTNIGNKLEDINKMHETFKRDSERSFRSAYYN